MGQHKYNPNVQLAKEGKLPLKESKKSKRQIQREIAAMVQAEMLKRTAADRMSGAEGSDERAAAGTSDGE